jgi:hypothetical protein
MSYGVDVTNRFDLLDEEGHKSEKRAKKVAKKEEEAGPMPAPQQQQQHAQRTVVVVDEHSHSDFGVRGRGGRGRGRGGPGRGRGRGRGRGGGAAMRSEENDGTERQFDRRGGDDFHRRQHVKKGGMGLGREDDAQLHAEEVAQADAAEEKKADSAETPAADAATEEKKVDFAPAEPVDEEDAKLQTYDQYLQKQKASAPKEDQERQLRTVTADDQGKWKAAKAIQSKSKTVVVQKGDFVADGSAPKTEQKKEEETTPKSKDKSGKKVSRPLAWRAAVEFGAHFRFRVL